MNLNTPLRFAIIGNPVAHSLSPVIHSKFAMQFGLQIDYQRIELLEAEFKEYVRYFFANGGKGLNITAPFKELAYACCSDHTERALLARSANTLFVNQYGSITADNTDGIGFMRDLSIRNKFVIKDKDVLLCGAGGAARGIIVNIIRNSPNSITIANRDLAKAHALRDSLCSNNVQFNIIKYSQLQNLNFALVINSTSADIHKQVLLLNMANFSGAFCYDLNYASNKNQFLQSALNNGAIKAIDGLGMLIEQAAEAFYVWTNLRPDTNKVLQQLHTNTDHISALYVL